MKKDNSGKHDYNYDDIMKKSERIYYKGTCFSVEYNSDGVHYQRHLLLAETYEEGMVFQVIETKGYDAGVIRGYIPKEFNDAKCVTLSYLYEMIGLFVFPNITKIKITNYLHSESLSEDEPVLRRKIAQSNHVG